MHQVHPNAPCALRKLTFAIVLALSTFGSPLSVLAADTATQNTANPQNTPLNFNIPPQPLADALNAFIATSDWQVGFPAWLAKDVRSTAVEGSYTPQQALQRLLTGSGLSYRLTGTNTVTLKKAAELLNKADPTTLKAMTVVGKATYNTDDPYNPDYNRRNTSTATKTDTPIMETPMSIQVVPRSVMNDQQATNILEPLNRNVSGVLARTGGGFLYDNFIIRGFSTNGFGAIYRNGLLNRQNIYDPANIEQIEVLKGPAAVLYGRIEPGGMINYVTKKPLGTPYYSLQQQFGSYDQYRTTVDATGPIDNVQTLLYRFNAAYQDMQSFRNFVGDERVFIAPSLSWKPNDKFEANLDLEYKHDNLTHDVGIPAIGTRPAPIPLNRSLSDNAKGNKIENILIGFNWTYHFNDDWKLTNRFQWQDWNTDFYSTFPFGMQADNIYMDRGLNYESANVENHAINLDLTGKFELFGTKHNILIGGDNYHSVSTYDGFWGATPLVPAIDIYNPVYGVVSQAAINQLAPNDFFESKDQWYGLYFQDQITLWDKLHILGGGRYDWAKDGSGYSGTSLAAARATATSIANEHFSPRVGVLYQPWKWLSLYGNYTQSFAGNNGRSFAGVPFAPQQGEQYEIGFKMQTFDERFSSTVAFYDLTKSNLVTPDLNNPTFSVLTGEAKSQGVEIDLKGQVTDKLNLIGTYAYTDARVTKDNNVGGAAVLGNQLSNVARNQGSLWGTYQITDRLKVGLGGVAVGKRQGDDANSYQLPGYVRMDAMAAYVLPVGKTRLTTQLNLTNLLDKDYYGSSDGGRNAIIPGAPISVMGSLRLEY